MKKRLISILLILVLLIPLCASAYATKADGAEPYNITDDVGLLSDADRQRIEKMAQTVTYKYGIGVYAVILDDYSIFSSDSAYAAAESIYHSYNMGQNSGRDGILLLLSMSEREYGLYYYGDKSAEVFTDSALQGIEDAFLNRFGNDDWAGGFEDYIKYCASYIENGAAASTGGAQLDNITDDAGLLSEPQWQQLEKMAEAVSQKYGVGVYIVTVDDYRDFNAGTPFQTTYTIYHEYNMGEGPDREGIMLLLSMDDRDWAIFCYGENSEYTFSESGRKVLKEGFLDNCKDSDWAGGLEDYIRECARFLESAAEGKPVKQSPVTVILIFCGVALLIALVATLTIWERMNSVAMETTAHAYISGNLELTEKTDRFTHSTETSRKIERSSSSSGSSSESGGGGSGSSGKF